MSDDFVSYNLSAFVLNGGEKTASNFVAYLVCVTFGFVDCNHM